MSKYTSEIRFICESVSGLSESASGNSVAEIIATARPLIFNFDYPIFDTNYKEVLESKILKHFYTREIGLETYGLWKLKLDDKLNIIMPYYNKLYESELIEFNPMYDVNYTRSGSESLSQSESASTRNSLSQSENTSLSQSSSESASDQERNSMMPESFQWNLEQETPQNALQGVADLEYLTRATKVQNGGADQEYINKGHTASDQTSASSSSGLTNLTNGQSVRQALDTKGYLESIVGYKSNNPSKLLQDYRNTFLNIDDMIIKELDELFMQLW